MLSYVSSHMQSPLKLSSIVPLVNPLNLSTCSSKGWLGKSGATCTPRTRSWSPGCSPWSRDHASSFLCHPSLGQAAAHPCSIVLTKRARCRPCAEAACMLWSIGCSTIYKRSSHMSTISSSLYAGQVVGFYDLYLQDWNSEVQFFSLQMGMCGDEVRALHKQNLW